MIYFFQTDRLAVREIVVDDACALWEMDSDPQVHQFLAQSPLTSMHQCQEVIEFIRNQYKNFGIGRWALVERESDSFVGWVGFKYVDFEINGYSNFYDFGYRLARRSWSRGYATEAGKACLAYGAQKFNITSAHAYTDVRNLASSNVLSKLGFNYVNSFVNSAHHSGHLDAPNAWYSWFQ